MDWRRWDNLEDQSLQVIPQLISKHEVVEIVPPIPKSITRLISSKQYMSFEDFLGRPTRTETIHINLNKPNLNDPFRNDTSGRQKFLHNLRSARAVIP